MFFDLIKKILFPTKNDSPGFPTDQMPVKGKTFVENGDPFIQLETQVTTIGHQEYPFLSKIYSPSSRVPAMDFSSFIKERLSANDKKSIEMLLRNIIEANPGLGLNAGSNKYDGFSWTDELIEKIINIDFNNYIEYSDTSAIIDLKALWILASKNGGEREFWITEKEDINSMLASAMAGYDHRITDKYSDLILYANSFIKKMRRDAPFWRDYELFKGINGQEFVSPLNMAREKFLDLSIGARVILCSAIRMFSGDLAKCSSYSQRNMGFNIDQVAMELYESDLLSGGREILTNHEPDITYISKLHLIECCIANKIEFKKSWNKQDIYRAIQRNSPEISTNLIKNLPKITEIWRFDLANEYKKELIYLPSFADRLLPIYKVLCFINYKRK